LQSLDALPSREIERWRRYWTEEPWGPWRDNMHTALLAVEVRRPQLGPGDERPTTETFMLHHVEDAKAAQNARMIATLETQAIKSERAERRKRKKP